MDELKYTTAMTTDNSTYGDLMVEFDYVNPSRKAIIEIVDNIISKQTVEELFTVLDLGTADGQSSMPLIYDIIGHIREQCGENKEIHVVYEDTPENDFNSLFKRVYGKISKPRSYLLDYNNVTVTATGTSFYNQCLPSNTVDLALSFQAHHWLSRRIVNPDSIFPQFTNLIPAKDKTKKYAKNDWILFLQQREKELKPDGWGYFSTTGLPCDTSESVARFHDLLLTETFEILLQNTIVTREEISGATISLYTRTADEFRQPFDDAGDTDLQLKGLATLHCPCPFKLKLRNGMCDRKEFDQYVTNRLRVFGYSSIFDGLDKRRSDAEKKDICEKFFQYFEKQLNAKNLDEICMCDRKGFDQYVTNRLRVFGYSSIFDGLDKRRSDAEKKDICEKFFQYFEKQLNAKNLDENCTDLLIHTTTVYKPR